MSQQYLGSYRSTATEFTRPADNTAYAVGDSVSSSATAPIQLIFPGATRLAGSSGVILSAVHIKSSTNATSASFRLELFSGPVTPVNDNSPAVILFANRLLSVGFIDFVHEAAPSGSTATMALTTKINLDFATGSAETALYGRLIARGAYTPASAEQHYIELGIVRE